MMIEIKNYTSGIIVGKSKEHWLSRGGRDVLNAKLGNLSG